MREEHQNKMAQRPEIDLRAFTGDDRQFFSRLATDQRVIRFVGNGAPRPESWIQESVRLALRQTPASHDGAVRWFIAEWAGDRVGLFVTSRHEDIVEIGYWVSPDFWGRGVAGAMLHAGLQAVAKVYGPSTVVARIDPANAVSVRVAQRQGFSHSGGDDQLDWYVRDL